MECNSCDSGRTNTLRRGRLLGIVYSTQAAYGDRGAKRPYRIHRSDDEFTGLVAGVVGFFVIPLVGFLIGGLLGVFLAEANRTGDRDVALDNTMAMLKSFGFGVLIESAAGIAMIGVWMATVLASGSLMS